MKWSNPPTRATMLVALFALLAVQTFWQWASIRFVLYDSQNRVLEPSYYDAQVVSADDYRRLSDPAVRKTELSDGTTIVKSPIWEEAMLPGYKRVDFQDQYILVTTKGTGHLVSYFDQYLVLFGILVVFGLVASFWNLKLVLANQRSTQEAPEPVA